MPAIVQLKDVVKEYLLGKVRIPALQGVSLDIETGEFAAIAGPSGSGMTLLNLIGCVDVATSGTVIVDGQSTGELNDKALTNLRLHKLGFIFQTFNLVQVLTVFQNVEFPLLLQGTLDKAERTQRVNEIIARVGLDKHAKHRPGELSGGQRQRVAVARALVTKPRIVLADEPTANLDSVTGKNIITLMHELNQAQGTTFIFSTHDHRVLDQAERIVQVEDGKITSQGTRRVRTSSAGAPLQGAG